MKFLISTKKSFAIIAVLNILSNHHINAQLVVGIATQEGVNYYTADDGNIILNPKGIETPSTYTGMISQSEHYKRFTLDDATQQNATIKSYLDAQGGILGPSNIDTKLGNQDTIIIKELDGLDGKKYQLMSFIDGSSSQGVGDLATVGLADQFPQVVQKLLLSYDPQPSLTSSFQLMHSNWKNKMEQGLSINVSIDPQRFAGETSVKLTPSNYARGGILALLFDGNTLYVGGVTDSEILIARNKAPLSIIGHAASEEWIGLNTIETVNPQISKQSINPTTDTFILLISDGVFKALSKQMEIDLKLGKDKAGNQIVPTEDQLFKKVYDLAQTILKESGIPKTNEDATNFAQKLLSLVIDDYNSYFINKYGKLTSKYKRDDITIVSIFPQ